MEGFEDYFKPIAYIPVKCNHCGQTYNDYNKENKLFHLLGKCLKQGKK